jgi:hypothetical protein
MNTGADQGGKMFIALQACMSHTYRVEIYAPSGELTYENDREESF